MKKKLISVLIAVVFLAGTMLFVPTQDNVSAKTQSYSTGAFDLGVANDERLIQLLKKQGKIPANATVTDAEKLLNTYLNKKAVNAAKNYNSKSNLNIQQTNATISNENVNGLLKGKGVKKGQNTELVQNASPVQYSGTKMNDHILVLLIDYNDFYHNRIEAKDTDMFYKDYTPAHYNEMLFGTNGYTGPNGENLISMKQYYEQQSGGSHTVDGTVSK